jgi:HAMP domain-containing protein
MTLKQVRNYIIAVGLITILLIATIFFTNTTLRNAVTVVRDLTTLQEVVLSIDQIKAAMEEERIAIGQFQLTGDDDLLARIDAAAARYDQNWAIILEKRGAEQAEVLADIEESRNVYVGMLNQVVDTYQANPSNNNSSEKLSDAITYYLQYLDPKFSSFAEPEIRSYTEQREVKELLATNLEDFTNIVVVTGVVMSVIAIVMSGLTVFNTQRILNAIEKIVHATNAISRGDLDVPIEGIEGGEIGELAQAVERMRTSLKAAIERLRRTF